MAAKNVETAAKNIPAKKGSAAEKHKKVKEKKQTNQKQLAPDKLVLLVTVVSRTKSEYYLDYIQSYQSNLQLSSFASGTAPQSALGMLTPDSEKEVLFSVLTRENSKMVMYGLKKKFKTIRGGSGLAFTIPMTSTIGVLIYRFLSNKE